VTLALDTSAAIPLLMSSHVAHREVRRQLQGHDLVLTQHSLAETYSVLTRLPGDARVAARDAVRLIDANFDPPALMPLEVATAVPASMAELGIVGGAVYDALVALAARSHSLTLVTRDLRASATYSVVGVDLRQIIDEIA
jgi:predicted nucleic acid-binding protein